MILVNPSPQPKLPKVIKDDPQALTYFSQLEIVIRQLRERTGGDTDIVAQAFTNYNTSSASAIFDIYERIGSDIPVTIDTTGFTIDTTEQTTDKTEV